MKKQTIIILTALILGCALIVLLSVLGITKLVPDAFKILLGMACFYLFYVPIKIGCDK